MKDLVTDADAAKKEPATQADTTKDAPSKGPDAAKPATISEDTPEKLPSLSEKASQLRKDMRNMMNKLADFYKCAEASETCGILKGKRCCQGFSCKPKGRGRCVEDCVNYGGDCTFNENCCGDGKCKEVSTLEYRCK